MKNVKKIISLIQLYWRRIFPKTLYLYEYKWRCGRYGDETTARGEGETKLLNRDGYMCCLGQFVQQIDKNIADSHILEVGSPFGINSLQKSLKGSFLNEDFRNSKLTLAAIYINDDAGTTIEHKVRELKKLFRRHGFKIKFIPMKKEE